MSKPVRLEVLIDNKTDQGIKSTKKSVAEMTADFRKNIAEQKEYVRGLEWQLNQLTKEISKASSDADKKKIIPSMLEAERELQSAKKALGELESELSKHQDANVSLLTQIRRLKDEMAGMTEGTDEYRQALERLGEMQGRLNEVNRQSRVTGGTEKNVRATAEAVAGLSGAMSAGVGVASLFGTQQEKLTQIQTRLQAVMATTIGLQQVSQTLNKDSYFSIVLLQNAKKKWAQAQSVLNTQLGLGAALSRTLMVSGVGLLIAGIASLVVVYDRWRKKQQEINRLKKEFVEIQADVARTVADEKIKTEQLLRVAGDKTKDTELRARAVEQLNKLMPEYNGYINSEGELIGKSNKALEAYVKNLVAVEKARKLIARMSDREGELEAAKGTAPEFSFWQKLHIGAATALTLGRNKSVYESYDRQVLENWLTIQDDLKKMQEQDRKELEKLLDDKDVFSSLFGDDKFSADTRKLDTSPENMLGELRLAALRRIMEQEIALMQEGEEKRKAQALSEFDSRIEEIEKEKAAREKHLEELRAAKIPVSETESALINEQAQIQLVNALKLYNQQIAAIDDEAARHFADMQHELSLDFASRLELQLADANNYYDRLEGRAAGNAKLLTQIEQNRIRAIREITLEAELQEIEINNDIALRREQYAEKHVMLEADRQKQLIEIELAGAKERLEKLEEMERHGMDTAVDIKYARQEVEQLETALKKLPVDRVKEIGQHLKSWMQSLSVIGGNAGEMISSLAASVDSIVNSLDADVTTFDKIGGALNSLTQLYSTVSRQIQENKQKQTEWNQKIEESAHIARMMRIETSEFTESNLFGVQNPFDGAIAGASKYAQAMKELNASVNQLAGGRIQTGTEKVVSGKNIVSGAAAGAAIGSIIPGLGTAIGAGIGALVGGIFGATQKKVVPVFDSLVNQFGKILKDGSSTFELNPEIIASYSKLDDATKKLIDNWEEIRNKAIEAQEQMRQTFSELAGDIGSSLSDALVDSFRSGDIYAAVDVFHKKLTGKIEDIVGQLVFASHFQKMFEELEHRFNSSFGTGEDNDIVDDIIWFSTAYQQQIDAFAHNMQAVKDELKKQGFDMFADSSARSAVAKGISGLTHDQGNKLEGQLTNVTARLMSIDKNVVGMSSNLLRIFSPINRIANNTNRLEAIEYSMKEMKEGVDKIIREGIGIKK